MSGSWHWSRFSVPKKGHKYHSNGPENRQKPRHKSADFFLSFLREIWLRNCSFTFCFHRFVSFYHLWLVTISCFPLNNLQKCRVLILVKIYIPEFAYVFQDQIFCRRKLDLQWLDGYIQFWEADLGASSQASSLPAFSVARGRQRSNFLQTCLQSTSPLFAKKYKTHK